MLARRLRPSVCDELINRAMEDRIIELETRVAYQDKLLSDLDEVIQVFAKRVETLEKKVRLLEEKQKELLGEIEPHDSLPPHYGPG